mgnify:CR=1 FL=1
MGVLILSILSNKQLIQLKVINIVVSERIRVNILQKLTSMLVIITKTEEMLNSAKSFVVIVNQLKLMMLVFWDIFELI